MIVTRIRALTGALVWGSVLALGVSPAWAAFANLGPAGDFNLFLFGDNTQFNSDVEGRLAVGGNVDFTTKNSSFTVGSKSDPNGINLVVGGNFKNQWNTLTGGMIVNGNVDWMGPTITGAVNVNGNADFHNSGGSIGGPVNVVGTYTRPQWGFPPNAASPVVTPLPFDFAAVQSYLQSESAYLASLAPNGSKSIQFQQVHLTAAGPAEGLYTFNVTGAELTAAAGHGLFISAPAGSTVVVNVDGAANNFNSMGIFLTGVDRQHVLYNFSQSTSLFIDSISIEGTILAPYASVNFNNGQINGTIIANNLTGGGESHLHLFQGTLPSPVPEPSTLVLGACGALALGTVAWRKRRA
ncbi:MAG: choice-of-anchor A family protein [Planctomycetaceae bacterium]|nr:choice-of-anchor A family protein [Planctomycetaceae bacterium]